MAASQQQVQESNTCPTHRAGSLGDPQCIAESQRNRLYTREGTNLPVICEDRQAKDESFWLPYPYVEGVAQIQGGSNQEKKKIPHSVSSCLDFS